MFFTPTFGKRLVETCKFCIIGFPPKALLSLTRMTEDWDRLPAGLRKAWNFKDGSLLHASCGAFLYFLDELKQKLSPEDAAKYLPEVERDFMSGHFDPELQRLMDTEVPPVELSSVSFLRLVVLKRL